MHTHNCPECGIGGINENDYQHPTHPMHTIMKCVSCGSYSALHKNGKIFQLVDPENPESQPARKTNR